MNQFQFAHGVRNIITAGVVLSIFALTQAVGAFTAPAPHTMAETTAAVGFLFLLAFLMGRVAGAAGLPRITGYLLVGFVVGPDVLGLVTETNLVQLDILNQLAIGVIAFIAGGELRPRMLRERGRTVSIMLLVEIGVVFAVVTTLLVVARQWIPFLADETFTAAVVLAVVFASVATIHSPAATIAVLNETKPRGPVSETILAIVVAADVVVVLLVTLTLSVARGLLTGAGLDAGFLGTLGWELVGAIIAGALLGGVVDFYLRAVGKHLPLVVIFLVLFGAQIASAIHVEFMLFMLSAGFFVENVSPVDGEPLLRALESVSVPAYALFFALAGASIHVDDLRILWPIALLVVCVRAAALWTGCRAGAALAGAEEEIRRYTWMGLVSQAGVALGLVTIAARVLPDAGGAMRTLFLAMIAIHELIGPILFRVALDRTGEVGKARERRAAAPVGDVALS